MASTSIPVPHMGLVEDVLVSAWFFSSGDHVEQGEPVVSIESDKAEIDVDAPATGRLEILVPADSETSVEVGTVLGWIHEP